MPDSIRPSLSALADKTEEELADIADAMLRACSAPSSLRLNYVDDPNKSASPFDLQRLHSEVASIKQQISNERSKNRSSTYCWYHQKFGKDARKCIPPTVVVQT